MTEAEPRPHAGGLFVVGISVQSPREGLGPLQTEIVGARLDPVLFVRRGIRPGILESRHDLVESRDDVNGAGPASSIRTLRPERGHRRELTDDDDRSASSGHAAGGVVSPGRDRRTNE